MKKLPKSIRKFIRKEKARIRRGVLGLEEQRRLILEIYQKFQRESATAALSNKILKINNQPPASQQASDQRKSAKKAI